LDASDFFSPSDEDSEIAGALRSIKTSMLGTKLISSHTDFKFCDPHPVEKRPTNYPLFNDALNLRSRG
jgi:hypothetical protein